MGRRALVIVVCVLGAIAAGCHNHVYSPPARTLPLETARILENDRTAVQFGGGGHGAVFGFSAASGSVRVSRGVSDRAEGSIEGTALHVDGDSLAGTDPWVYALRGGVKLRVLEWLAVSTGLGGGVSAAGAFVSPDIALVAAPEHWVVAPWFGPRLAFSLPIDPREVDTTPADGEPGTNVQAPHPTMILGADAGVRLRLRGDDESDPEVTVIAGLGLTRLDDFDEHEEALSIAGAVEIVP